MIELTSSDHQFYKQSAGLNQASESEKCVELRSPYLTVIQTSNFLFTHFVTFCHSYGKKINRSYNLHFKGVLLY